MACHDPIQAWRTGTADGKTRIVFSEVVGDSERLRIPCGKCLGCRLDRAAAWAVRCGHEASLYDRNAFVTLTYDDSFLPPYASLRYSDVQKFLKRLRKREVGYSVAPNGAKPIRFFAAGEYGDKNDRPHYHLLLFNFQFSDLSRIGKRLYESELLSELWPYGHASTGSVTAASAAYVSQYSLKKVFGRNAYRYQSIDVSTGELAERRPEFCVMSRRPGIGAWWFEKFGRDVLPCDYVIVDGKKKRVPRYYMEKYKQLDEVGAELVRETREEKVALIPSKDRSYRKLQEAEVIALSRHSTFNQRKL